MAPNRRAFLKWATVSGGVAAGSTSWWLSVSKARAARYFRQMLADAKREIKPAPVKPVPERLSDNCITICWLGHATVLINYYGVTILTDPAFFNRVGIRVGFATAGPKRYIAPALRIEELPPIDLVLLSHGHMDHMDLASLRALRRTARTVTAKVTSDILEGTGLQNVTELGWNQRVMIKTAKGELELEAVEVKHWGQRWPRDRARGYNGYVLRREGKALLFAGDTARTALFTALRSRGPFEAAIMPIGAYRPWIWNHCTPEEAAEMADRAGARYIVPVHHQTFRLSQEPMNEPIQRLEAALAREPERLALRRVGESFVCPT